MQQMHHYDPVERQQSKQRARDADDSALRAGQISREALGNRNGFFSSLEIVGSSVHRRGIAA